MKRVYTGNYDTCKSGNLISISGDRGKGACFRGKAIPALAPKKEFWQVWHQNIGKVEEKENNIYYIQEYYEKVLKNIDLDSILEKEDYPIFLCYEPANSFCHRHILASYIELVYDTLVFDVETQNNKIVKINDRPKYIKEVMWEIMRRDQKNHYVRIAKKKK